MPLRISRRNITLHFNQFNYFSSSLSSNSLNIRFSIANQFQNYSRINKFNKIPLRQLCTSTEVPKSDHEIPKKVAYWLFGVAGLVIGMVTVGGFTRLTKSGLSMTDWKLQGKLPPLTQKEWEKEFDRYKQFPEWQQRQNMTLEEFKYIFYWEYGHRMMGRVIGASFVGPMIFYIGTGVIPSVMYPRMALLLSLGGGQGLVGWWMVKSGLNVDPTTKKEIRVSPYRLATHLGLALTTYTALIWTALDILHPSSNVKKLTSIMNESILKKIKSIRSLSVFSGILVASTIISGAFVAGNDAGRAYNSFPLMGDYWIPPEILDLEPIWKNFFENTCTVQFDHRILALSTLSSISYVFFRARLMENGNFWKLLPANTKFALTSTFGMSWIQVGLGISTLLYYVPIPLAASHQAGSVLLLTCIASLVHSLRFSSSRFIRSALTK